MLLEKYLNFFLIFKIEEIINVRKTTFFKNIQKSKKILITIIQT